MKNFSNFKKIACGHIFHSKCINMIYKPQCPLCECPIFNQNEEAILKCNDTTKIIDLLITYFNHGEFKNLYFHIIESLDKGPISSNRYPSGRRRKRYFKILKLAYKHCDFTDILAASLHSSRSGPCLSDHIGEKGAVEELIEKARINWHKTFNGKTFFELAIEKTDNLSTLNLILDKLPYGSLDDPYHLIYPSLQEPSAPSFADIAIL